MNKKEEIKNRIDLINKGEVPEGYKKNKGYIIPDVWDIYPAGNIFKNLSIKNTDNSEQNVLSVTQDRGVIPREDVGIDIKYNEESLNSYKKVKKGNFIISLRSFQGGIEYSQYDGIVSPAYTILENILPINDYFYATYLKMDGFIKRLNTAVYGIRDGKQIGYDDFSIIPTIYPPKQEQEKIAEILSCCDKVIELKEQLIKHYYEKRNFIIGYFLKNIKSKNIVKLRDICEMFSGGTPSVENRQYYNNGTIPFIKSGEIENDKTEDYITEDGLKNSSAKLVKQGDLLVALYGANSGNVALSKISGAVNQAILCIRSSFIDCYYLLILLKFNKDRIIQKYLQGGQGNLSAQIIKSLKFKIPTIEEQKKIVTIISNIDKELKLLEQELEQYKQLKKALSQLLLTGIVRTME